MSLAHPPPQDPPAPSPTALKQYEQLKYATAAVAVVILPIIAILPPRKLDLYTIGLISGAAYSANHLVRGSRGSSIWQTVTEERRSAGAELTPESLGMLKPHQPSSIISELQKQNRASDDTTPRREAWKIQREKEIKEDVEEGKGFGDMIVDQIWEVWNWGKTGDDENDS